MSSEKISKIWSCYESCWTVEFLSCHPPPSPPAPPPPQVGQQQKDFATQQLSYFDNQKFLLNLPITVDVFAAGGLLLGRKSALRPNKM